MQNHAYAVYRESIVKLAESIHKTESISVQNTIRVHMMRFLVRGLGMNSAYWIAHDFDEKRCTTLLDYVDTMPGALNWHSTVGESFHEDEMGNTTDWLHQKTHDLRVIHVDDLPEGDPEREEYEPDDVHTVVLAPIYHDDKMWGFLEIWDRTKRHELTDDERDFIWFTARQLAKTL